MILKSNSVGKVTVQTLDGCKGIERPLLTRTDYSDMMDLLDEQAERRILPFDIFLDQLRFRDNK